MERCKWCLASTEYMRYHDNEWGVLRTDDSYLFEMLILESFQAGLSWECILNKKVVDQKRVPGAFAMWDNTPRHNLKGHVYEGASPEKFEKYLKERIKKTRNEYKKDMIFVYAWNEWAEGGYLEPDKENRYGYLQAIHNALETTGELPLK